MPTFTASAPASTSAARRLGGRDVARDQLHVVRLRGSAAPSSSTPCEWPCAVSTTSTSTLGATSAAARSSASGPDADGGADAQAALVVLRRVRVLDPLLDVLDGDEPLEPPVGVDDRELLDLVPVEDLLRLLERRPDRRGDELRARSSAPRPGCVGVGLEAEVAVREDADEAARRRP